MMGRGRCCHAHIGSDTPAVVVRDPLVGELVEALEKAGDVLRSAVSDAELNSGRLWAETKRDADDAAERIELLLARVREAQGKEAPDAT